MRLPRLGLLGWRKDVRRLVVALERIATAQEEMAGLRKPTVVPEADEPPPTIADPQSDDFFALVEEIQERTYRATGKILTPEEIADELDGLPIDPIAAREEWNRKAKTRLTPVE